MSSFSIELSRAGHMFVDPVTEVVSSLVDPLRADGFKFTIVNQLASKQGEMGACSCWKSGIEWAGEEKETKANLIARNSLEHHGSHPLPSF